MCQIIRYCFKNKRRKKRNLELIFGIVTQAETEIILEIIEMSMEMVKYEDHYGRIHMF